MRTVSTLYGLARRELSRDRVLLASFVVAALVNAAGHASTSVVAGLLAKSLLAGDGSPIGLGPVSLTLVGLVSALVKGAAAVWTATAQSRMAHRVGNAVRAGIAHRLLADGSDSGVPEILARTALRVREVERGVDEGLLAFARASVQLVPLAGVLIVLSPWLALGSAILLVPFGVGLAVARRSWRSSHARAMHLAEQLHREIDELVRHIDVFRTYGAGATVEGELARLGERAGAFAAKAEGGRAALSASNEILAALGLLVVVASAPALGLSSLGSTLIPFATVLFMAYRPLRDLGDARSAMTRGSLALEALEALTPATSGAHSPKKEGSFPLASLAVEGVGVVREGMSATSFAAAPGEVVAIVGPTGAGKTTLLRALLGLEPQVVGSVRYGDEDLTRAKVGPASRPFAWVPQEAPIVTGTLAANIVLGRHDPEAAHHALASVGASQLARECGDVVLGAGGRPVSGGERRLIGLARAFALGAPVLLLDEPTEGLDELSQARVLAALERLRGHRTVILVTHRREPLRIADQVVRIGEATSRETTSLRR